MPVSLQSKLLRVFQEKKVRRVGSLNEVEIDLKIISTVNKDPHKAIADGLGTTAYREIRHGQRPIDPAQYLHR